MTDPRASNSEELSWKDVLKTMKKDPTGKGFTAIGRDGVMRTFDGEYNILDARGLSPRQLKGFLDAGPYNPEGEKQWRGVDGMKVTSEEGLFRPDPSILPKKPTPEEKAARRKVVEEHNRKLREEGAACRLGEQGPVSNHDLGIDEEDRDAAV